MPLRLNVGVSRNVGLPSFPGVEASCHIELDLELEPGVLESDLEDFHRRVRSAYVAAHQAVNDELARLRAPTTTNPLPIEEIRPEAPAHPDRPAPRGRSAAGVGPVRPATPNQARAIRTLARRGGADLDGLLRVSVR